eukprot:71135_1
MDRKSESETEDVETCDFDENRTISELQNKVLKLQSWRTEIGYTAIKEAQEARKTILKMKDKVKLYEEDILALKQENATLQIELNAFEEEHSKWETERNDLLSELNDVSQRNSLNKMEEVNWAKSVEDQYRKIDRLTDRHRRSHSDLVQYKQTISELLEEKQAIGSTYTALKQLNHQREDTVNVLKEKLKNTQDELADLRKQFEQQSTEHLIEREKYQKLYNETIIMQLNEYAKHNTNDPEAISIGFNPKSTSQPASRPSVSPNVDVMEFALIRRRSRSRSIDSDGERLLHHIDIGMDLDEKEAYDMTPMEILDEEKIRKTIEQELRAQFDRETQELKQKYQEIQNKNRWLRHEYEQMKREQIQRERNNSNRVCWLLPWTTAS